jgi:hypothetical protein
MSLTGRSSGGSGRELGSSANEVNVGSSSVGSDSDGGGGIFFGIFETARSFGANLAITSGATVPSVPSTGVGVPSKGSILVDME